MSSSRRSRSLKASQEGIVIAKQAFYNRQWTQEFLAAEVGLSTRNSIWKFFSGRAIERNVFMEICFKSDLEWENIANLPKGYIFQSPANTTINVDETKEEVDQQQENISLNSDNELEHLRHKLKGQIEAQCANIQTPFNLNQQLPLKFIYIDLNVLKFIRSQRWLDLSEFQDIHRQSLYPTEETSIPAVDATNSHQKLIIIGQPGSGKSTFLQSLALQCLEQKFQPESLPIFISLKILVLQRVPTSHFSLIEYIKKTWSVFDIPSEKIELLATQGKILVLLDGLEEVCNPDHQIILAAIQQFTILYHQCKVIITCRVGTPINFLQGFHCVELAELNNQQAKEFVKKWFTANKFSLKSSKNLISTKFLEQLKRPENLLIKELIKSPILLSLLCSVFQERGKFPNKLSKLYQESLEILLRQNNVMFATSVDSEKDKLSLNQKLILLSEIAYIGWEKAKFYYEKQELIDIVARYINREVINNQTFDVYDQAQKTIQLFIRDYGVLVEIARGIFTFSHLTFQEYLTAKKFIDDFKKLKQEEELQKIAVNIHDIKWRSLIFLILEMFPDRQTLINKIKEEINNIIENHEKLTDFFYVLNKKQKWLFYNGYGKIIENN